MAPSFGKWVRYTDAFLIMFSVALILAKDERADEDLVKPVLSASPRIIIGGILAAFGLFIAASSGIGGGGILVPIYILVMGVSPTYAIALSNITILGGSLANTWLYMHKSHPKREDRSLIDFNFAILMEPPTMAGAMIGTIVNKNSPVWLTTMMLVTVLILLTLRMFYKGFKLYKNEEKKFEEKTAKAAMGSDVESSGPTAEAETNPLGDKQADNAKEGDTKTDASDEKDPAVPLSTDEDAPLILGREGCTDPELIEIYESEKRVPWKYLMVLPMLFGLSIAVALYLKLSTVTCGTSSYWLLTVTPMLVCYFIFAILMYITVTKHYKKKQVGYEFCDGDVMWSMDVTIFAAGVCWVAGVCAGLFGIGGGVFKAPQMLEMGMLPEVVSATVALMIVFTSASATISYSALGLMAWDLGGIMFFVGIVATYIGQVFFDWFMIKYMQDSHHSGSYIVFSIAIVLGVSTVLLAYTGVVRILHTFHYGDPNYVLGTCG